MLPLPGRKGLTKREPPWVKTFQEPSNKERMICSTPTCKRPSRKAGVPSQSAGPTDLPFNELGPSLGQVLSIANGWRHSL